MLRNHPKTLHTPIIFLTVRGTTDDKVTAMACGANDYVVKPYEMKELMARVDVHIRLNQHLKSLVQDRNDALTNLERVKQMAMTDPVTGLFNRRYFHDMLSSEFLRAQRYGTSFSCMILDLDHFKEVNDSLGHDAGDLVLREISQTIHAQIRDVDTLARYGGDEWAILLPQVSCQVVVPVAERILNAVQACTFPQIAGGTAMLSISIGIAGLPDLHVAQAFQLVAAADFALLRAKRKGRNQLDVATHSDVGPLMPIP